MKTVKAAVYGSLIVILMLACPAFGQGSPCTISLATATVKWDGSDCTAAAGSGLTSLNGETAATQTFASSSGGSWGSSAGVHTYTLGANLIALAGLTGAANKGVHFTGVGAMATHDLSAYALTLLDDTTAGAARTTLGLVGGSCTNQFARSIDSAATPTCASIATADLPAVIDLTSKTLRVPNSTTLPATCTVGDVYDDTDATSGARLYLCESTNTWAVIGSGGGGSGATTALDNLASVAINTALLPGATSKDLGSAAKPFEFLYLHGAGTYGTGSFKLTGTPTAARTVTFPDASITVARTDASQTFTGAQIFPGSNVAIALGGATSSSPAMRKGTPLVGGQPVVDFVTGDESALSAIDALALNIGGAFSIPAIDSQVYIMNASQTAMATLTAGSLKLRKYDEALADVGMYRLAANDMTLGNGTYKDASGILNLARVRAKAAAGTNIAGSALYIDGGAGTGTGVGGALVLETTPSGSTGTTVQTPATRDYLFAGATTLTESTATTTATVAVASGTVTGGTFAYTIESNDGTDYQVIRGKVEFSAVNKAGTVTVTLGTPVEVTTTSTGTLTNTTTATASGNTFLLKLNAVSSLTQTVLRGSWRVQLDGGTGGVS